MSPDSLCGRKNPWISIDFKTNGEIDGTMCCNSFTGKYDISPGSNSIAIFDLSTTSLDCLPRPALEDSDFLSMIDGIWRAELVNSELLLHSAVGDGIWRYRSQAVVGAPIATDGSGQKAMK